MNWKDWYSRKYSKYVGAMFFIIGYILTIPIRGYEFFDISDGVPLEAHLIIILFGVFVVMTLHWLIEIIVKRFILYR